MKALRNYDHLSEFYKKGNTPLLTVAVITLAACGLFLAIGFVTDESFLVLGCIFAIFPLLFGLIFLINRNRTAKSVTYFTPEQLARINEEVSGVPESEGYRVTRDALISVRGGLVLCPVGEIIWIYKETITTRYLGLIPVAKNSDIAIYKKDKKRITCKTKNKTDMVEFLRTELNKYTKGIFFGYSPELYQMFTNNFGQMLSISRAAENQSAASTEGALNQI